MPAGWRIWAPETTNLLSGGSRTSVESVQLADLMHLWVHLEDYIRGVIIVIIYMLEFHNDVPLHSIVTHRGLHPSEIIQWTLASSPYQEQPSVNSCHSGNFNQNHSHTVTVIPNRGIRIPMPPLVGWITSRLPAATSGHQNTSGGRKDNRSPQGRIREIGNSSRKRNTGTG